MTGRGNLRQRLMLLKTVELWIAVNLPRKYVWQITWIGRPAQMVIVLSKNPVKLFGQELSKCRVAFVGSRTERTYLKMRLT